MAKSDGLGDCLIPAHPQTMGVIDCWRRVDDGGLAGEEKLHKELAIRVEHHDDLLQSLIQGEAHWL